MGVSATIFLEIMTVKKSISIVVCKCGEIELYFKRWRVSRTNRQTDWQQHIQTVRQMKKTDRQRSLQRCRWANYWQQYCISDIKVLQWRPWQLCSEAENYGYLKSSSFRAILIVFSPPTTPKVPNSPSRFLSVPHPFPCLRLGSPF